MLRFRAMPRRLGLVLFLFISNLVAFGADRGELWERRQRAATMFRDGILLVHANSTLGITADGFRQDPSFYYFTGLADTPSALLAIDGRSGQAWLFLNQPVRSAALGESMDPISVKSLRPEVSPGQDAAERLGMYRVEDWSELEQFMKEKASSASTLYYVPQRFALEELPPDLAGEKAAAPLWAIDLWKKWPAVALKDVGGRIFTLMGVQSAAEIEELRAAAHASVPAILAGMRAIRPGVRQRSVEVAVENTCWQQHAHGVSFWPWVMAGANSVFPHPWQSLFQYDHLDGVMQSGDLVRLDIGCEWNHYQGDLGRTVPVSGRYSDEQRETWNIFVDAYKAGVNVLRDGVTIDEIFQAWSQELLRHRASARTALARDAIDAWSKRENVPFWGPHTINLDAGFIDGPLRSGMTIAFEPIASIHGQGFYLEDMFVIQKNSAEILTPGVPYSAEDIESAMK
jgi:Xaa-Pro aminopeptidase